MTQEISVGIHEFLAMKNQIMDFFPPCGLQTTGFIFLFQTLFRRGVCLVGAGVVFSIGCLQLNASLCPSHSMQERRGVLDLAGSSRLLL